MNDKSYITIATSSSWIGIYQNGELQVEGHPWTFPPKFWISIGMKADPDSLLETKYVDEEWIEDEGNFPKDINQVQWAQGS